MRWAHLFWIFISLSGVQLLVSQQQSPTPSLAAYTDSTGDLQKFLQAIFDSAKSKDTAREDALIRSIVLPAGSTWFRDEFGPAFGPRLETRYRNLQPRLEPEVKMIFEENIRQGWTQLQIFRYDDAAAVDSPIDHYLNCMEKVVPLYRTAFNGKYTAYVVIPQKTGSDSASSRSRILAGDLPGYYVFADGGFRYIPEEVLLFLPRERPIRIQLGMDVMRLKIANDIDRHIEQSAFDNLGNQHVFGDVTIRLVVDINGKIKEAEIKEGPPELAAPILQAVKQWVFEPTTLDGDPVEVEVEYKTGRHLINR
jgi:Gram-negative bacterial TonB protein C-terminal